MNMEKEMSRCNGEFQPHRMWLPGHYLMSKSDSLSSKKRLPRNKTTPIVGKFASMWYSAHFGSRTTTPGSHNSMGSIFFIFDVIFPCDWWGTSSSHILGTRKNENITKHALVADRTNIDLIGMLRVNLKDLTHLFTHWTSTYFMLLACNWRVPYGLRCDHPL